MSAIRKPRILVADHDRMFLDQLTTRLLLLDMEVDFAENGRTAIKLVETEEYDLIVTAIALPLNNGLEILRSAKAINPDLPVLIITFAATRDWAEQALREGAYSYLLRPLTEIRDFDDSIERGLSLRRDTLMKQAASHYQTQDAWTERQQTNPTPDFDLQSRYQDSQQISLTDYNRDTDQVGPPLRKDPVTKNKSNVPARDNMAQLPDGILEINADGQILSCNHAARKWLMLESAAPDHPIKSFLKSFGQRDQPATVHVQINGTSAYLLTKRVKGKDGTQRSILLIREARKKESPLTRTSKGTNGRNRRKGRAGVAFHGVKKATPESMNEYGWSPLEFFDKVKKTIKDEVDRFLETPPKALLDEFITPEPEEPDPEAIIAMSNRISDIS
ncbi:MAG: response regulator [Anaerolineales bacterium]|nr:response regulator [Anaerolineales bacterium]